MNDIKKLKEQQKDKHPGFGSYLECMTRALFTGLGKNEKLHNFDFLLKILKISASLINAQLDLLSGSRACTSHKSSYRSAFHINSKQISSFQLSLDLLLLTK